MHRYWDDKCKGGVYWDTDKTYKNSVTNQLFIELGVKLYQQTGNTTQIQLSKKVADWLIYDSHLISPENLFYDGLNF